MQKQVTRNNHYIPQSYLKSWSYDGNKVWCYRILVSNENVPFWKFYSIKNIAYITDLYSCIENIDINDSFERWIKDEFEDPGFEVIHKLKNSTNLNKYDIEKLVRFLALQDVRTPCNYFETQKRWENTFPKIASEVLDNIKRRLNEKDFDYFKRRSVKKSPFRNIKALVEPVERNGKKYLSIGLEALYNRETWIDEQKHLLENTSKCLLQHSWSLLIAAKDNNWFTSDYPVARCNYYSKNNCDLLGGWGNKKGNILMPLTPKYLLFTQIGDLCEDRKDISVEMTIELNDIIIARAYRYIFSVRKINRVSKVKSRIVDIDKYNEEKEYWESWKI